MKCFNHHTREAVAICKACGRAVCPECGIVSANGIACRQSCVTALSEKKVRDEKQAEHFKNIKRMGILGSLFSIGVGILFVYFSSQGFGAVYDFIFLLGAGFAVYGIITQVINMVIFFRSRNSRQC